MSAFGEMQGHHRLPDHVADFVQRLDTLNPADPRSTVEMPDLTTQLDHNGNEIDHREYINHLDHAAFSPDVMRAFGDRPPGRFSFAYKKGWSMGRDESQHNAFLGVLTVRPEERQGMSEEDAEKLDIPVVVRTFPFQTASHAAQEYALLQDLRARMRERERDRPADAPHFSVVEPIALIANRWSMEPSVFMITRMAPDLESLNAQDWRGIRREELRDRVAPVVDSLAVLHEQGVFPHEMAFGNTAVGEAEGSRYLFDLESAKSFREMLDRIGPDDELPFELMIAFRSDFQPPRISLRDLVIPQLPPDQRPRTEEELFMLYYNTLYEPYQIAISQSNSPYAPVLQRLYKRMIADLQKEISQSDETS